MRAAGEEGESEGEETEHEADKVIVRSNGTVTYTGKDIAFHLWKLGQFDLDFYYKKFHTYEDGHEVWITTSDEKENDAAHPRFGRGDAYFNVIDIGQSYPQHYVKLGVMAIDHDERVERSAHLAYEKVLLSVAAAERLGQQVSDEDRRRGAVAMSNMLNRFAPLLLLGDAEYLAAFTRAQLEALAMASMRFRGSGAAVPMAFWAPAPAPLVRASGNVPKKNASEVMMTGRSRILTAIREASV